ncbi:MAG: tetratricopeptide repeat protein, partial [Planctomycetes bacterium]|nr:tetratricopeptide repeat protein [Planctomycetota bacterium]
DQALTSDPRYARLHYMRGRALYALGRYPEAALAFWTAVNEDVCPLRAPSNFVETLMEVAQKSHVPLVDFVALAYAHSENGVPGRELFLDHVHPTIEGNRLLSLEILTKMREEGLLPSPPPTMTAEAIDKVARELEAGIDPKQKAQALKNLSKVLGWAGKLRESYDSALKAAELEEEDPEIYYQAGKGAQMLGLVKESMGWYQKALDLKPGFFEARGNLASLISDEKNLKVSIEYHSEILAKYPDDWRAHQNLGHAYLRSGELDQAEFHTRAAIRLSESNPDLYFNLGLVYQRQDKFNLALQNFERALKLNPTWPDSQNRVAWFLSVHPDPARRDPEQAAQLARQAVVATQNQNFFFRRTLAVALAAGGNFKDALSEARQVFQAIEKNPAYRELMLKLKGDIESYLVGKALDSANAKF